MLLRAYRLTDRLGLILLKLSAGAAGWLLGGAEAVTGLLRRVLVTLFGFLLLILTGLLFVLRTIARFAMMLLRGLLRVLFTVGRGLAAGVVFISSLVLGKSTEAARAAGSRASGAMARRAARAEMDVVVVEDPLRTQNRRLSLLVLVLGIVLIGALLWATDPQRASSPIAAGSGDGGRLLDATAQPTQEEVVSVSGLATPIPTATQVPVALQQGGALAFVVRERAQQDIWMTNVGGDPIRITNDPADERDPAWSPDGAQLAYASRQNGNWEVYVYDVATQNTTQQTFDLSFQANPDWSPDGEWLVYESYQGRNLDIYAARVDGSQIERLTDHPSPDYSPAWSPDGRRIAFVSLREANQDIYILDLDTFSVRNLTNTPTRDEDHPAWSSDGEMIAFSATDQGRETVFVQPMDGSTAARAVSFGRTPSWSPQGNILTFAVDSLDGSQTYLYAIPVGQSDSAATQVTSVPYGATAPVWTDQPLPRQLIDSGGVELGVDELYVEQINPNTSEGVAVGLSSLLDVRVDNPVLSDAVNDSFNALRERVAEEAGWDFLGRLDDAWWRLERPSEPGEEPRNWHKTGRAFSITRNSIQGFPPEIEVVREEIGVETYWRIYLRVDEDMQSGQLGEPLRRLPWDFLSALQGDVEAYNQGGRRRDEVPAGYYIDFTQLAEDYGWQRRAAASDWRGNVNGRNYWMYWKPEGLDWYSAMSEIYTQGQLVNFAPTQTPAPPPSSDAASSDAAPTAAADDDEE